MANLKQEVSAPLVVYNAPFIRSNESITKIMWTVVVALLPSGIAGVYIFGIKALYVIITSVVAAVFTEGLIKSLTKKPSTINDGSAVITGLLLAYNLPPAIPLWMACVGASFAVAVGKLAFGGLGYNIFNPALVGRTMLMMSWPRFMTQWSNPRWIPDAVSSATPLAVMKKTGAISVSYMDLFLGSRGGCIGEVCIIALLVGALFLLMRGYITLSTPIVYIGTVGILSWLFGGDGFCRGDWLFFILSGGLVLGAFFMATDYVTTPLTTNGQIFFGLGCGAITFIIRKFGGYPEGVSYSILIMNAATPIIDRFTRNRKFGQIRKN